MVIAGDSLLHRINSRKMMVNKIPSVKLTKRGDNLSGTVSRLTTYISKHSNVHLDIVFMAGTNDLSKRDVTPEVLIKELDDSITVIKRFSNVGQIFLCKIPQIFDHRNINTKVCLFNELLVEHFLDTEDFLTVVDTVQPEIKFYYEDGLHLSNSGISKLCDIILSRLYKILAPTSHKSRVSARQNHKAFVQSSSSFKQYSRSNSKQAHGAHSSLKIGCWNVQCFKTARLYFESLINRFDILAILNVVYLKNSLGYLKLLLTALTIIVQSVQMIILLFSPVRERMEVLH